ncbi:MAG: SRPBCC family protein [Acidimicrobiales bacterium]
MRAFPGERGGHREKYRPPVRYADGPTAEVTIHIDAPPARVWSVVTDISMPARFSDEFQGANWLDGATGPATGARFMGRNRHPATGEWETTSVVVACEPERVFGWAVGDADDPTAEWRFELEPDNGGTRLRQWARMGPAPSGLTFAIMARPDKEERIVARRLEEWQRNMTATVEGIKAIAEGRER